MNIQKNIDLIIWMWKQIEGFRSSILLYVIIGIFRIVISLSFIWISKEMIDVATQNSQGNLFIYAVALTIALLIEMLSSSLFSYIETNVEVSIRNRLRMNVFNKAINRVWNGKEKWHTGDLVNRLEEDVRIVSNVTCSVVPGIFIVSTQFVSAFIFLWYISQKLAWATVFIMPAFLLVAFFIARKMKRLTKQIRESDAKVQSIIQESLQKRIIVIALMRVQYICNRLTKQQNILFQQYITRNKFSIISRFAIMSGFGIGYLVAFIWGVSKLQEGLVTFGMLSAFLQLVNQIQRPTADLSRRIPSVIHSLASAERLYEIYTSEQDLIVAENKNTKSGKWKGIYFDNVTFGYNDSSRKIFSDFSYNFLPGSSTAIMGETGAGKSTMMRLMLGLLKPDNGNVFLYNEFGEKKVASPETRLDVVYVPQGNSLLSGTIRDNIIAGNFSITESDINKAIYMAAAEFIYDFPDGLGTICGEGGEGLSEGQAQRISIARALLSSGQIMLLDEFTSALDTETEKILMDRLTKNSVGKTMVFITHRKEIADRCTNVLQIYKTN